MTRVNNIGNLRAVSYAYSFAAADKVAMPVAPNSFIYSNFKHVRGTPAPEGSHGVSISKLKVLDVLIDQLVKLKKESKIDTTGVLGQSDERLDALIKQYSGEIKQAQAQHEALPYRPAPALGSGSLFSLMA
jgi:hypothetical protein